jgi:hypothetical protein
VIARSIARLPDHPIAQWTVCYDHLPRLMQEAQPMRRAVMGVAMLALGTMVVVNAQKITPVHPGKGGSPHVRAEWVVDGANISIEYGRPSLNGRTLHAGKLVPYGEVWRTGADEPTTLKTDKMLMIGNLHLAPGSYTLWTLPSPQGWQLIIATVKPGQWGTQYDPKLDLGRLALTVGKTAAPVEQLTISIDDTAQGATLRIEWGTTRLTAPFTTM